MVLARYKKMVEVRYKNKIARYKKVVKKRL